MLTIDEFMRLARIEEKVDIILKLLKQHIKQNLNEAHN